MIEKLQGELNVIAHQTEAEKAKLYRGDGRPVFAEDTHKERLAAIAEQQAGKLAALLAKTDSAAVDLADERTQLAGANPLDNLTDSELQRANLLAKFVQEDIATLPITQLAARFEALAMGNDKATLFLMGRYITPRLANVSSTEAGSVKKIRAAMDTAAGKLSPGISEKINAVEAKQSELAKLQYNIRKQMAPAGNVQTIRL